MGGGRPGRRPGLIRPLCAALAALLLAALPAAADESGCDPGTVTFYPDEGPADGVAFAVEVADEPEEQARGLMFRTVLAPDAGMIFVFPAPRPALFWMKNTVLPLDMIFVGDDGRVVNVAARTTPFSERTWRSAAPVRAVVEVNGGLAGTFGIGPGTEVRYPAFASAEGAHACPQ